MAQADDDSNTPSETPNRGAALLAPAPAEGPYGLKSIADEGGVISIHILDVHGALIAIVPGPVTPLVVATASLLASSAQTYAAMDACSDFIEREWSAGGAELLALQHLVSLARVAVRGGL